MKQNSTRQSGHALAIAMACIFILLALGVSLIGISGHVRQQASHDMANITARTAADAALQMAINEMQIRLTAAPWDNSNLPEGSGVLPNSEESYKYKVTGNIFAGHIINVKGTSGMAVSNIHARFKTVGLFEYAILVREYIDLGSNALVDSVNSGPDDRALEIAARSGLDDSVILGPGVTINGDVLIGAAGEPDDAVKALPGYTVNGDIGRMMDIWEPPFIYPPDTLAALPSLGTITTNTTITTDSKIDVINLDELQILTIDGDVDLYVTGDIILGNSAQIQITAINPDSSLTLYVGGTIEEKNGASINNLTADAQKLSIYGLEGCTDIDFKNSGQFYGTIYAPNADVVFFNSLEMTGALVANSFIQKATAIFHYDVDLRTLTADELGLHFVIDRWSED